MNETSRNGHQGMQVGIGFGPEIRQAAKSIDDIPKLFSKALDHDDSEIGCSKAEFAETLRSLPDL
jgi:hypothetical protein